LTVQTRRRGPGRIPGYSFAAAMNRYRCYLFPGLGLSETGVLPYLQLRAATAELAARLALAVSGALAVVEVVRLEEIAH
jgi:hypothetical protein